MAIKNNVSLASHSTMRLGGKAKHLAVVSDRHELVMLLDWAKEHDQPVVMIGEGSNIVWTDAGFNGLVLVNAIKGYHVKPFDEESKIVTVGSGESWDGVVERTVKEGLSGIEALSLIPGTAGATPVQNVGAYGQEISDVLVSLEAYDQVNKTFVTILAEECQFSYRQSRFKSTDRGRFFIVSITLQLNVDSPEPPFYESLQDYLDSKKVEKYTPEVIRDAVIAVRTAKLPDPKKVANNGSFFGNPLVSTRRAVELVREYPELPNWAISRDHVKLSAAWLIEQAGFKKGYKDTSTGMAIWDHQSLVLVNEKAKSAHDLLEFRDKIMHKVYKKFKVRLLQEPEIIKSKV